MLTIPFILADVSDLNPIAAAPRGGSGGLLLTDTVIILGAVLGLVILIVIWAVFIRKREDRRYNTLKVPNSRNRDEGADQGRHRRRRRHHRRDHRSRNPTLAETGGLPPIRPEQSPPPKT
jgi:hypothetical protein